MDATAYDEVSGYTEPSESEHDFFVIGHTSTSVSLATGLAKARDLKGGTGNVIAVIGDGSLSGGEAFEGLNSAAELGTNFIVIVNDNQMSIAENHGGLYRNLQLLRETDGQAPCNFFTAMGLDYLYVKDGNNVQALIDAFRKVKDIAHPLRYTSIPSKVKATALPSSSRNVSITVLRSAWRRAARRLTPAMKKITATLRQGICCKR